MGAAHSGNVQPSLDLEEHTRISGIDGRKVFVFDNAGNQVTSFGGTPAGNTTVVQGEGAAASIAFPWVTHQVSGATIYAIVNTAAAGQSSVVLDASLANIGFATVNQVNQPALVAGVAGIGFATVAIQAGVSNIGFATITAGAGVAFIGHATVRIASNVNTNIGLVTVDGGTVKSLVSLSPSVSAIGFATVAIGANANTNIGLVTIDGGTVKSLVSLGASVQNIGFATVSQAFPGGATVFTQVISLTSTTTIAVAPASNLFFIKNLHVSSLGRSEVEIRSGATTLIPFTSLSTTSGFNPYYGEYGLPSRAQADALVVNLAVGSSTIAIMANLRFGV